MGSGIFCFLNDRTLFLKRYGVVDLSGCDKNVLPLKTGRQFALILCMGNSVSEIPLGKKNIILD